MNIVIVGAGEVGVHLASLFSKRGQAVILLDKNPLVLEKVARDLDIAIKHGSGADWELLEDVGSSSSDLLIAVTGSDETNVAICAIAKNLGFGKTIARVRSDKYFLQSRINLERIFGVDYLIYPELLAAHAIANAILLPGSIAEEGFANGNILLRTVRIPSHWKKENISLSDKEMLDLPPKIRVGLIHRRLLFPSSRKEEIIFPTGSDVLMPLDEATFIGASDSIQELHKWFGIHHKIPHSAVIVGGSLVGIHLAKILEQQQIRIRILDTNYNQCCSLAEKLPFCTVINRDGTDYKFMESEKMGDVDAFIACTHNDEVNFLSASIAKDLGCKKVLLSLSNTDIFPLVAGLGFDFAASSRLYAANRILAIAEENTLASVSLYNNQVDIMEVKVSMQSKVAGIPLKYLHTELPKDLLLTMIQSRGRIFPAEENRVLSPGDTVVIVSHPRNSHDIKEIF